MKRYLVIERVTLSHPRSKPNIDCITVVVLTYPDDILPHINIESPYNVSLSFVKFNFEGWVHALTLSSYEISTMSFFSSDNKSSVYIIEEYKPS